MSLRSILARESSAGVQGSTQLLARDDFGLREYQRQPPVIAAAPAVSSNLDVAGHNSGCRSPSFNYWRDAARQVEQDDPALMKTLYRIQEKASSQGQTLADKLLAETQKSRERLIERRWKVRFAGRELVIREKLESIIKSIQAFKDLGSSAAAIDPILAGLPWAGACLVMQIALNDSDQYAKMVAGVEEVTSIVSRYKHVEVICSNRIDTRFKLEFEEPLIAMYKSILKFQVSAACYYQRPSMVRFLRSIPKLDDVEDILSELRRCDAICTALGQVFDTRDVQLRHIEMVEVHIAHKEKLDEIAQKIDRLSLADPSPPKRLPELPFAFDRDPKFTAREDIMELLRDGFQTYRRMALVGWAGVGKSQIAIEFAHRLHDDEPRTRIFWIRGARQDLFLKSYRDLARRLDLTGWDDPETDVGEFFRDWLCDTRNGSWLLVLDNVDDETVFLESNFQKYLPQVSHGSLLITSRNRAAARDLVNEDECLISVERLSEANAISLLRKKLPRDKSPEKDALQLVQLLEKLPLAITQAAAYISKGSGARSISLYLKLLESDQVRLLEYTANDIRRDSEGRELDFSNSVLKTWSISFEYIKMRNPDAAEILCFMSLVVGQGIPMEYLLCGHNVDLNEVEEGIAPLEEFSLIFKESGGSTFSIHRLVQLSVRSWLQQTHEMEKNRNIALKIIWYRFPDLSVRENWSVSEPLMPHADVVLNYKYTSQEAFEHVSFLLSFTASYYWSRGKWSEALKRASQAYDVSVQHFEASTGLHRTRFMAQLRLAEAHDSLGNQEEAERLARLLVADSTKFLDPQHFMLAHALGLLGKVLASGGKYLESENAHRKALSLHEERSGKEAPAALIALANLAAVLGKRFEMEEALVVYQDLLGRSRWSTGESYSDLLLFKNNYGSLLTSLGRYEEAEEVLYETYLKREKLYTENHPDTLMTLVNYAMALGSQAKHKEAKKWNDRAIFAMKQSSPAEHNPMLMHLLLHNASIVEIDLGNTEEARRLLETALALAMEYKGTMHPDTFLTMKILGECEIRLHNYSAAEDLLSRAHAGLKAELGNNHVHSLEAAASLADLRRTQGLFDECEGLLQEVLPTFQRVYGPEHWKSIRIQLAMAKMLGAKDHYEESITLLKTMQTLASTRYGNESPCSLDIQHAYAKLLGENFETHEESILKFEQVLIGYKQQGFDDEYNDFVLARAQYAGVLTKCGKFREAEEITRMNVAICRLELGNDNETTLRALKGLASVLSQKKGAVVSKDSRIDITKRIGSGMSTEDRESREQEILEIRKEICRVYAAKYGPDSRQALAASTEVVSCLIDSCQYSQALEVCEDVFTRRKQFLGQRDPEFLESCHQKANLLRLLKRFREAEELNRETAELRSTILGKDSDAAMDSKNSLALCMRALKMPRQALQVDMEILGQKQRLYGQNSPKILHTQNNLAMDYFDLLEYEEARNLLERVVQGRSQKVGPDHIDTALSLQNLGETLARLEKWQEAEPVLRRALEIRLLRLGQDHDSVDNTVDHLQTCLQKQGRSNEAVQIAEGQLQRRKEDLGIMHPRTLSSMVNLAIALDLDSKASRAEPLYRQYFDLRRQIPDENVVNHLESLASFSYVLRHLNKIPEALPICRKVFKGREILLGTDHQKTLFSGLVLTVCLHTLGSNKEAKTLCCDLLARSETSLGTHDTITSQLMHRLALISHSQADLYGCLTQLRRLLHRLDERNQEPALLLSVLQDLAVVCTSLNHLTEGRRYVSRLLEEKTKKFGAGSLEAAETTRQVAAISWFEGNMPAAEKAFKHVLAIYRARPETSGEDILNAESSLSETLFKQRKQAEAEEHCRKAIAINQSIARPRNHPNAIQSQARLARLLTSSGRYVEAEAMASAVIAQGEEKSLPASHTAVLASRRQLARLLALTGRREEALHATRAAFYADIDLRGKRDRGTLETANDYGNLLQGMGKYYQAQGILRATLRKKEAELGEESFWTVGTRRDFVVFLCTAWKAGKAAGVGTQLRSHVREETRSRFAFWLPRFSGGGVKGVF